MWQGLISLQVLRIPIKGFPASSSAPMPSWRARERWLNARRPSPSNHRLERSSTGSVIRASPRLTRISVTCGAALAGRSSSAALCPGHRCRAGKKPPSRPRHCWHWRRGPHLLEGPDLCHVSVTRSGGYRRRDPATAGARSTGPRSPDPM